MWILPSESRFNSIGGPGLIVQTNLPQHSFYQAWCLPLQDSDYENPDEHSDSEMYVMPAEETGDDSYEPPPAEQQTRVVHPALPFTRGEYVGEANVEAGTTGRGGGQT